MGLHRIVQAHFLYGNPDCGYISCRSEVLPISDFYSYMYTL